MQRFLHVPEFVVCNRYRKLEGSCFAIMLATIILCNLLQMMRSNTKWILLLLPVLLLLGFYLGSVFSNKELKQALVDEQEKTKELNERLHLQSARSIEAGCALEEFYADAAASGNKFKEKEDTSLMMRLAYRGDCPPQSVRLNVVNVKRKQSWDRAMDEINARLVSCNTWFDSVQVLSVWLYQNTRVGDIYKYPVDRVIGKTYVLTRMDIQYLYEVNNSDSVVSNCGFHGYYALLFYEFYGIKSYCYSMRFNPQRRKSAEGHMVNIVQNPHDKKWYPVDNFFGIRYTYQGKWLDIETYFRLAAEQKLDEVRIVRFGDYKFHIQESPCVLHTSWNIDTKDIITAELSNYRNHFRIVAPFTLQHRYPQFSELFDSIAVSYSQPVHTDWKDLARRMPLYGARLFPLTSHKEQAYADSLLHAWRQ